MTGNLRYPTADGRVLQESDRKGDRIRFSDGHQYEVTTTEGNPLVFDATCTTCKGMKQVFVELDVPEEDGMGAVTTRLCSPCKGTGVDETIPLHLVGVGSRLSREDRTDLIIVGKMDDIAFCVEPDGHAHQPLELAAIGRVWTVTRAVPPAHTEGAS
jgi:hypothetical protein